MTSKERVAVKTYYDVAVSETHKSPLPEWRCWFDPNCPNQIFKEGMVMMICPKHRTSFLFGEQCSVCKEKELISMSCEFDKQDRIIDTMVSDGKIFMPEESRAILVFKKGGNV